MRLITLLLLISPLHDFHVTHTTVTYNGKTEAIEITIKTAIEDLETALEGAGAKNLRIGTAKEDTTANTLIEKYFRKHFSIAPNSQPVEYKWVGKEISKDLHDVFIYFEIANCNKNGKIESLLIENTIFTEMQPKQSNIVLVDFEEHNYNLTFTKAKTKKQIRFND